MTEYWFKPKRYGYGATPVTWQGWAVTIVFCMLALVTVVLVLGFHKTGNPWAWIAFFVIELLVIMLLCVIARYKTGGEWRWRWGK